MKKKIFIFNLIFIIFITSLNFNSYTYANPAIAVVEGAEALAGLLTVITGSEVVRNTSVANDLYEQYKEVNEDVRFLTVVAKAGMYHVTKKDFERVKKFAESLKSKNSPYLVDVPSSNVTTLPFNLHPTSCGCVSSVMIPALGYSYQEKWTPIGGNFEIWDSYGLNIRVMLASDTGINGFDNIISVSIDDVSNSYPITLALDYESEMRSHLYVSFKGKYTQEVYNYTYNIDNVGSDCLNRYLIKKGYLKFGTPLVSSVGAGAGSLAPHLDWDDPYYKNKKYKFEGKDGILFPKMPLVGFDDKGFSLPLKKNLEYDVTKELDNVQIWKDSITAKVENNTGEIGFLKTVIAGINARLDSLTQDVIGVRDTVGTLGKDVIGVRDTVGTLGKDVIGLNNRINDVEKDSTNTKDKVISLGKDVAINTDKVGNLEKEVGKLKSQSSSPPFLPSLTDIKDLIRKLLEKLSSLLETILKFFDVSNFSLDFSKLKVSIKTKFPFCIPFDYYNAIKLFQASMKEPQIRVKIDYLHLDYIVPLGPINYPRMFFRFVAVVWYAIFLMGKTRDFIKW